MTTFITPPPLSPDTDQLAQPVIVKLPPGCEVAEILVQHQPYGVEVSVRHEPYSTWVPAVLAGVEVEVRSC